eukprot:COSAG02_NODE_22177_length_761_cov_0.871601_1_plen_61_part_00
MSDGIPAYFLFAFFLLALIGCCSSGDGGSGGDSDEGGGRLASFSRPAFRREITITESIYT